MFHGLYKQPKRKRFRASVKRRGRDGRGSSDGAAGWPPADQTEDPAPFVVRAGCLYGRLEWYDEAIADFSRSLDLRMKAGTLEDRGDCYAARGDTKRTVADYEAAREKAVLKDSRKRLQDKIDALR